MKVTQDHITPNTKMGTNLAAGGGRRFVCGRREPRRSISTADSARPMRGLVQTLICF